MWDSPTMIVTVDQKRRIVLPKSVKPGEAMEMTTIGGCFVLHLLQRVPSEIPPVASHPLKSFPTGSVDLDEPAFPPMPDALLS